MSHVRYEQDGPVVLITIDRPERMNAIGPRTHTELVKAWRRFRDDDGALAVLTGAGDRASRRRRPEGELRRGRADRVAGPGGARGAHARRAPPGPVTLDGPAKPTIAAVNGVAYAGGLEWVCWTDLAVADAHATFGVTCRRWNVGLADGGTQRLPRIGLPPRHGADPHRARDRRRRGPDHRPGERGRAVGDLRRAVARARARARRVAPAGDSHRPRGRGPRVGRAVAEGLRIEAECFDRLLDTPEIWRACGASTSATTPTAPRAEAR